MLFSVEVLCSIVFFHISVPYQTSAATTTPVCRDISISKTANEPQYFCVAEASKHVSSVVVEYANGSCFLFQVCATDGHWPCPIYRPLPEDRRILLLRTHASSGVSPYQLFINSSLFSNDQKSDDDLKQTTDWFKSPLLRSSQLSLSYIELQMRNKVGTTEVRLKFSVIPGDRHPTKGDWFAKDRLVESYPWSIVKLQGENFNIFSMKGYATPRIVRRFYINKVSPNCFKKYGYMFVSEWKGTCSFEVNTKHSPAYLWTADGDEVGHWNTKTHEAEEFLLFGVLSGNDRVLTGSYIC